MKINIVVPSTVLGGGLRVIFLYSNYMISKGHDVIVYVPMLAYSAKRGRYRIKTSLANTFKRRTKVKWMECNFEIKLVPLIKDCFIRDADISIATACVTAHDVYELSKDKGKKVYFIQDYELWNIKAKDMIEETYKLDLNRIVITKKLGELLRKKYGSTYTVIYNGNFEDEYIKAEKIINNPKTVIMLYNAGKHKGAKEGLSVLSKLYKKFDIRIILFGRKNPGDLPEYVEFYEQPKREFLMELYRQSDIILFPSLNEAWGLTVMEGMSNKCAVVGNNTGCLAELCNDNNEALIVEDFNLESLEKKLVQLINDEELLKRIQNNGYNLALNFKWENSYKKFEDYLFNLIKEN